MPLTSSEDGRVLTSVRNSSWIVIMSYSTQEMGESDCLLHAMVHAPVNPVYPFTPPLPSPPLPSPPLLRCSSNIGRIGGRQNISIGGGCESKGVVMHEMFHALGRWHEQSRPDRNLFVTVREENIKSGVLRKLATPSTPPILY